MPQTPYQAEASATPEACMPERRNPARLILAQLKQFGARLASNARWTMKFLHGGK